MHRKRHNHHSYQEHVWAGEATIVSNDFPVDVPATRTFEKRAASSSTCLPDDNSPACEKYAGATNSNLPIILGAAIPFVCALILLIFLHRRHMNKLKQEELEDKTKSMDFGMGFGAGARKGGNGGEKLGKHRQLSMDLDLGNPYIINGNRSSLGSLGAGLDSTDPRYGARPGTSHSQNPNQSGIALQTPRNYAPSHHSNLAQSRTRESSLYTASIRGDDSPTGSSMSISAQLLHGAQAMPTSSPPPPRSASLRNGKPQHPQIAQPMPAMTRPLSPGVRPGFPSALQPGNSGESRESYEDADLSVSKAAAAQVPIVKAPSTSQFRMTVSGPSQSEQAPPPPPQFPLPQIERPVSDSSNYEDDGQNAIQFRFSTASDTEPVAPEPRKTTRDTLAPVPQKGKRLSMGFRPLPPDGTVDENAEERAIRIRSFYKEYFDDSNPEQHMPPVDDAHTGYQVTDYIGGYDQRVSHRGSFHEGYQSGYSDSVAGGFMPKHQDDSTPVYDPSSDRYVIPGSRPFAEPPVRRAMTPPPRMPQQNYGPRSESSASGRFNPPGPRSYTSNSSRPGSPYGVGPPKKAMPPPSPLKNLPTPAQLGEDAFSASIAFAPKFRTQDIITGRDSPSLMPGERPYSPAVSPHVPLASSMDELAVLSAPHSLRNSTTYTSLDFAPPKKFKNEDSQSDAGSIRSNRSNAQIQNIRAGAYRISRLPQDVVPLRDDMAAQLRPTMDLSQRY
ncbi:hypothetical protein DFH27DRAFT_247945 [Peziza echinospora]|nr:hypothetical protein DFH27DRAFT_247945 [Peziza echinospora]